MDRVRQDVPSVVRQSGPVLPHVVEGRTLSGRPSNRRGASLPRGWRRTDRTSTETTVTTSPNPTGPRRQRRAVGRVPVTGSRGVDPPSSHSLGLLVRGASPSNDRSLGDQDFRGSTEGTPVKGLKG